jgi:hypothetical protein
VLAEPRGGHRRDGRACLASEQRDVAVQLARCAEPQGLRDRLSRLVSARFGLGEALDPLAAGTARVEPRLAMPSDAAANRAPDAPVLHLARHHAGNAIEAKCDFR